MQLNMVSKDININEMYYDNLETHIDNVKFCNGKT